jgi:hypothetical protein
MLSDSWRRWLRLAATPFVAFAAVVFLCGFIDVSPFASWSQGLVLLLCAPSMVPLIVLVTEIQAMPGGPTLRRRNAFMPQPPEFLPQGKFRWISVLTPRRATVVGLLTVVVVVSFFSALAGYRGSPEMVDGQLVFTDHGKVIGPATQREADEASTSLSRLFTGHFLLFGTIGLLAEVPAFDPAAERTRPRPLSRARRNRPPGSGRPRRPPSSSPPRGAAD